MRSARASSNHVVTSFNVGARGGDSVEKTKRLGGAALACSSATSGHSRSSAGSMGAGGRPVRRRRAVLAASEGAVGKEGVVLPLQLQHLGRATADEEGVPVGLFR